MKQFIFPLIFLLCVFVNLWFERKFLKTHGWKPSKETQELINDPVTARKISDCLLTRKIGDKTIIELNGKQYEITDVTSKI